MSVFEIKGEVLPGSVPAIEQLLAEHEEQHLMVLEDKPSSRAWLIGYFETRAAAETSWGKFAGMLDGEWLVVAPTLSELPDKDWKESYKQHFKAWKFGRLHWVPIWERDEFQLPLGDEVLWLDPGMAFGTGNHETTRLVVERLIELATRRGTTDTVIDAGCGSGILALSAVKLGFSSVAAFDNDALAVDISRENARLNGLEETKVEFYVGDLITGLEGRQAGILLANIQADVLMKFAEELVDAVAPDGALVLSGILVQELEQVRGVFGAARPTWRTNSRAMGEWCDLVLTSS
jgi:ribosomal protein L11 methyltransferase